MKPISHRGSINAWLSKRAAGSVFWQIAPALSAIATFNLVATGFGNRQTFLLLSYIFIAAGFVWPQKYSFSLLTASVLLIPADYLNLQGWLSYFPPSLILLSILTIRVLLTQPSVKFSTVILGIAVTAYLVVVASFQSYIPTSQALFFAVVSVFVWIFAPNALRGKIDISQNAIGVITIAAWLSSLALFEYITGVSPLRDFYAQSNQLLIQKWETYRVFTVLGHPLVNGLVFAFLGTLLFSFVFQYKSKLRFFLLIPFSLTLVAEVFSGSRSGLTAFMVGVGAVLLARFTKNAKYFALYALAAITLLIALNFLDQLGLFQRFASYESSESGSYRWHVLASIPSILDRSEYLGGGAFSSQYVWSDIEMSGLPLENSFVQLLASLGPWLFVALLLSLSLKLFSTLRSPIYGGNGAALIAYLVAAAGFNFIEAYPSHLAFLSVLLSNLLDIDSPICEVESSKSAFAFNDKPNSPHQ